jgi:uncharacterized protein with HEPN domain
MQPEKDSSIPDDRLRLQHILDAARAAQRMATGRTRADLDADEMLRRALTHCFMEIGEAAARISEAGRARIPQLPWGQIVHVRHIVVHVYWGVDRDRLWQGVGEDLPPLMDAIAPALADWPTREPS